MATSRASSTVSRTPTDSGVDNSDYFARFMVAQQGNNIQNINDPQAGATAPSPQHALAEQQQQLQPFAVPPLMASSGAAGGIFSEETPVGSDVDFFELSDSPGKAAAGGKRRKQLSGAGPRGSSRGPRGPPSAPPSRSASPRGRRAGSPRPLWADEAAATHRLVPRDPAASGPEMLESIHAQFAADRQHMAMLKVAIGEVHVAQERSVADLVVGCHWRDRDFPHQRETPGEVLEAVVGVLMADGGEVLVEEGHLEAPWAGCRKD